MSRGVAITGSLLIVVGLALFVWKAAGHGLPVAPSQLEGLWRVELEIRLRGVGRGSVRVPLPSSRPGQVVFDEHASSDQLRYKVQTDDDQRTAVWSGRLEGVHEMVHRFRVDLSELNTALPAGPSASPPEDILDRYTAATVDLPAAAPEILELLEVLRLPGPQDPAGRVRMLFNFVSDEIAPVGTGSDHALLTLATREGQPEGQARLLVTLLRAAGIPARPVAGLRLRSDTALATEVWAEAWLDGDWIPMSPAAGFFARRPRNWLALRSGSLDVIETTGVEAMAYRYHALREHLRPDELAAMMRPENPLLASLSLYRLPLGTQSTLRALLLLPLGTLVIAVFRNVIGVPTFGTFMPILIAFTLRSTSLWLGLAMVAAVIATGILGRLVLERLRLLLVPRLSILLCVVVLSVTALALLGESSAERELVGGVLFPMVILTMLIERFAVAIAEEGLTPALVRAGYSTLVAVVVYPLFRSAHAEHLMFSFPELVICTMGVLVLLGGYTGYRVADLIRFRALAHAPWAAGR